METDEPTSTEPSLVVAGLISNVIVDVLLFPLVMTSDVASTDFTTPVVACVVGALAVADALALADDAVAWVAKLDRGIRVRAPVMIRAALLKRMGFSSAKDVAR